MKNTKIAFSGFAKDKFAEFKKSKDSTHNNFHSRFDDNMKVNSNDNIREVDNFSATNFLKLMHVELENWYYNAISDFHNLENRLKTLKKTHATLSIQFHRSPQEEEGYKREMGVLLSLVQKCDGSIEDLKELSSAEGLSDVEYKARQNMIMKFKLL